MRIMPKHVQCLSPTNFKKEKRELRRVKSCRMKMAFFLVRESSFSLEIRAIRPSAVFGIRRAALRGEGFTWVPDLGSFFKLREVGVSPYLVLFPL